MQTRLDIGSHVFIIEGNRIITEVVIAKQQGNFYMVRFLGGGAIQLRRNRLFTTKEDAEQALPKNLHIAVVLHMIMYIIPEDKAYAKRNSCILFLLQE